MKQYPQKGGSFVRQEDGSLVEHRPAVQQPVPAAETPPLPAEAAPTIPEPADDAELDAADLADKEE